MGEACPAAHPAEGKRHCGVQVRLNEGYQEIVLTGIRLGQYRGKELEKNVQSERDDKTQKEKKINVNLFQLLQKIVQIPGRFRIRLSSIEVTEVSDELINLIGI